MSADAPRPAALPREVWALGFVSLLMDCSSEAIHSLLPLFMISVLGASALSVGIVEGIAEATAAITKLFSGVVSDAIGRRKPLILLGYGLAAVTKPFFALAPAIGWVAAARFADRLGKGIRGAPRDALLADVTPPAQSGAAFGLRQSLDTVGAFAGPLLAIAVMALSGDNYRLLFWIAAIPAALSVATIILAVREPAAHRPATARRLRWAELRQFPRAYWLALGVALAMTLARFSEGFLLLRAQSVGLRAGWVPLVLVAMNVVYALSAYPVGRLSDRVGRRGLLLGGMAVLVGADLVLAAAQTIASVMAGVLLWGLHMGMTQGLFASLVADSAPPSLRGTAFGLFNLVSGLALLLASVIAGGLWSWVGPAASFLAGAVFTASSLLGLLALRGLGH